MNRLPPENYLNILETGRWFRALDANLKTTLIRQGRVLRLCADDVLFSRGDARCGLYAVVEGMIRISGIGDNGKEAILTFVDPPNWFGEIALFDGQHRTHDAIAEVNTTVIHCPQDALDALLARQPVYWQDFGRLVAWKLRLAFQWMEDQTTLPAPIRLAKRLVLMAEGYGDLKGKSRRLIPVPQEQLGMTLGISRQTTNQILKELESANILKVSYGVIELLDLEQLKSRASVS